MKIRTFALALLPVAALWGAYTYYYSDTFATIDTSKWTQNGTVSAGSTGLTSSSVYGGSLISSVAVPGGTSNYLIKSTLTLTANGGTYVQYARASSDAMTGYTPQGTFVSVELQNCTFPGGGLTNGTATLVVNRNDGHMMTQLSSSVVGCHNGMTLMTVIGYGENVIVHIDGDIAVWVLAAILVT